MLTRFSAYELREMEVAEKVVPFGEYAMTLRSIYLARAMGASQGSEEAAKAARDIMAILTGDRWETR